MTLLQRKLSAEKFFVGQSKSTPEHVALSKWIIINQKVSATNIALPDSYFKNAVLINNKSSVDFTFCLIHRNPLIGTNYQYLLYV